MSMLVLGRAGARGVVSETLYAAAAPLAAVRDAQRRATQSTLRGEATARGICHLGGVAGLGGVEPQTFLRLATV